MVMESKSFVMGGGHQAWREGITKEHGASFWGEG